jgi:hypothetical protein
MISEELKFIFVHIPKTGGTAVANALGGNFRSHAKSYERDSFGLEKHATIQSIKGALAPERLSQYFKFCFVRNPFDRLVSHHFHVLKTNQLHGALPRDCTFGNYVDFLDRKEFRRQVVVQHEFIVDEASNSAVDFVGRFESLQSDFDFVCDKLGMPRKNLNRVNSNEHPPYAALYDRRSREKVEMLCRKDIEYFGYCFGA